MSKEEEELIAMKALMIKDKNLQVDDKSKRRKKKKTSSKSSGSAQNDSENGKKIPKWKLENPKNKSKINKNDKTYYWCKHYNKDNRMWVLHTPDKCCNKARTNASSNKSEDRNDNKY